MFPSSLLPHGPWGAIVLAGLLCLAGARVLASLLVQLLVALSRPTPMPWSAPIAKRLQSPLALTLAPGAMLVAWPWLRAEGTTGVRELHQDLRGILLVGAFWTVARTVSVVAEAASQSPWAESKPHLVPLSEFTARVLRVSVMFVGAVTLLGEFGFPVASLLAGVGVGGIAVALAAQKTMENLFGSVSLLADAPFRVGDRVTFDGATGTVLSIGLRSTRLRTDDARMVVMPNGKLADMRIENLSVLSARSAPPGAVAEAPQGK